MSQIIKLEKRFEKALDKLEIALAGKNVSKVSGSIDQTEEFVGESRHNINDLLIKIEQFEKAAKNDAEEIDKLVRKLREILETEND